jgi:hypothetical protein
MNPLRQTTLSQELTLLVQTRSKHTAKRFAVKGKHFHSLKAAVNFAKRAISSNGSLKIVETLKDGKQNWTHVYCDTNNEDNMEVIQVF